MRADGPVHVAHRQFQPDRRAGLQARPRPAGSACCPAPCPGGAPGPDPQCRAAPGGSSRHVQQRRQVQARRLRSARWPRAGPAVPPARRPRPGCGSPSWARYSRTSAAMNSKKFTTNSGLPAELPPQLAGSASRPRPGRCPGGTPASARSRTTTSGAVANPNSSAPSSAAMMTSRPVLSWPSICTTIRSRSPLRSSVCWVSASPISHGRARVLDAGQRRRAGAAVVPGDQHHVRVRLGHARRDGADAHLGDQLYVTRAAGLAFFRSRMSWARSSIE